jgi:hypothetical protein
MKKIKRGKSKHLEELLKRSEEARKELNKLKKKIKD